MKTIQSQRTKHLPIRPKRSRRYRLSAVSFSPTSQDSDYSVRFGERRKLHVGVLYFCLKYLTVASTDTCWKTGKSHEFNTILAMYISVNKCFPNKIIFIYAKIFRVCV